MSDDNHLSDSKDNGKLLIGNTLAEAEQGPTTRDHIHVLGQQVENLYSRNLNNWSYL